MALRPALRRSAAGAGRMDDADDIAFFQAGLFSTLRSIAIEFRFASLMIRVIVFFGTLVMARPETLNSARSRLPAQWPQLR
jgi:hypothetical protein